MHHHHHRHNHFHFFFNRELNELYLSIALRTFGASLISIFVPIYLLTLEHTIPQVTFYFILLSVAHFLITIPAAKFAAKKGFKHCILYSTAPTIAVYIMLYTLGSISWPLWSIAIIAGIANGLYWMGFHVDFAKFSDKENRSKEVGTIRVISTLMHATGPILGGVVATIFGFGPLFVAALFIFVISIAPLFHTKDTHAEKPYTFHNPFKGHSFKEGLAYAANGVEASIWIIVWPIIIFYAFLNSYTALGAVQTLALTASVAATLVVSKFSDKYRRKLLKAGAIVTAAIWSVKIFITSAFQVYVVDILQGAGHSLLRIPFESMSYDKANKEDIINHMIFRELSIHAGKMVFFTILTIFATLHGSLITATIASVLMLLF